MTTAVETPKIVQLHEEFYSGAEQQRLQKKAAQYEKNIADLTEKIKQLEKKNKQWKLKVEDIAEQKKKIAMSTRKNSRAFDDVSHRLAVMTRRLEDSKKQESTAVRQADEAKDEAKGLKVTLQKLQREKDLLERQKENTLRERDSAASLYVTLEKNVSELKKENDDLKSAKNRALQEKDIIEQERDTYKSKAEILEKKQKELMKEKIELEDDMSAIVREAQRGKDSLEIEKERLVEENKGLKLRAERAERKIDESFSSHVELEREHEYLMLQNEQALEERDIERTRTAHLSKLLEKTRREKAWAMERLEIAMMDIQMSTMQHQQQSVGVMCDMADERPSSKNRGTQTTYRACVFCFRNTNNINGRGNLQREKEPKTSVKSKIPLKIEATKTQSEPDLDKTAQATMTPDDNYASFDDDMTSRQIYDQDETTAETSELFPIDRPTGRRNRYLEDILRIYTLD
ncbi:polyamine-modulated factor 1-binding protein 1-like [Branchiostoma floridae]|uniref:Polyamine-modulated factor 1-binding protein 1-like n=1 Tax=Branchiostoma floridae TaxID=7739 RepID=A0A9J7K8C4_BRAFL|nr:polyamine-modulated factor 1-binding protein 1-like [Branchiostoma floridae]